MKKLLLLFALCAAARCFAADGVGIFQAGLQAFQANGADALLNTWYNSKDDADKIALLRERLTKITQGLGPVVETQVFAPHDLGRHVQKLYGVIYFEKRPLWLRAEYYEINGRGGLISLEWSLVPEDILPLTWAANPSRN
jgi:hypothetical protein